jgi:hypothetical protein
MNEAISHPDVGRLGIALMADFTAPTGSIYYDAIFGAFHGQLAIRQWLVPAMAEIEFIDFVPMAEPLMFDDGEGGTSLDEWQMVMNLEGQKIPLSRGVSVRRYRDGWIFCPSRFITICHSSSDVPPSPSSNISGSANGTKSMNSISAIAGTSHWRMAS